MTSSKGDHNNWITVGEIIRLLKEPVALYTSHIVQTWHTTLTSCSGPCQSLKKCQNPGTGGCSKKKNPRDLCSSCKGWYDELTNSHRNKDKRNIKWRQNCDTSKWPDDPWEVAKFFMSVLGDNKGKVKDAESSDLSSLLNVLEWMEDTVFAKDRRVDLDLVKELRSEVRNPWAHAPNQELPEGDLNKAFEIAKNFAADLDEVFSCPEVNNFITDIQSLQANGLTNVTETELKIFKLQLVELGAEFSQMKEDQSADSQAIKKLKEELKLLQDHVNAQEAGQRSELKNCIPDKPPRFIGREAEVKEILTSLVEERCGIVSIVGGPGFGKTTIAIEVSHRLKDDHDVVVIFSYLEYAPSVSEMKRRLCRDIGLIPGEDPDSVLMLWVKSIERKFVIVLDNIDQLLEGNMKDEFTDLVLNLRKNSQQNLEILTTTRTKFSIVNQTTKEQNISELDHKYGVEVLRKFCCNEEVEDSALRELAQLCGGVPLALCIAGSRIPDFGLPSLIQCLKENPLGVLDPVQGPIRCSFGMLSDEDQKSFVRLVVFKGRFRGDSAKDVLKRSELETQNCLKNLETRSLIQNSGDKCFVIHSLIRQFLADLGEDKFLKEKEVAQQLMVQYFLELCHSLTVESYSYNKFTKARDLLKKDAHNVQEMLKVCSQDQTTNPNPNIIELLTTSDLYKSSSRFFYYYFSWDILPETILRNFFEYCINLAKSRNQVAVEITFQCLVADQEGRKSAWKSEDYANRMEAIRELLSKNEAELRKDRLLFTYCYCYYIRYNSDGIKLKSDPFGGIPEDDFTSSPSLEKASSPFEKANEARIFMERAHLEKKHANKVYREDKEMCEKHMKYAESFYNQALDIAKEFLGNHEITCNVHKMLGDLYLNKYECEKSLQYYDDAVELRKELKLDGNEQFVFLLKNYGACLFKLNCYDESVRKLLEALDIAEKLNEQPTLCKARVNFHLAITYGAWKPDLTEAAKYAEAALEMKEFLHPNPKLITKLEDIIKKSNAKRADMPSENLSQRNHY